ncbi:hypothetical protein [Nocardia sp. NPDC050406]|uniref:hypothetical protein n=1 Tax=Nocardia sp. NPDC050406 TaxID=3364318 RepID=UPI0037957451
MSERVGTDMASGHNSAGGDGSSEHRRSDAASIAGVALLPMLLLLLTVGAAEALDEPATRIGKILELCLFIGVAAQVPLAMFTVASLIGAIALARSNFRVGHWFARVGAGASAVICGLFVAIILTDALDPGTRTEWHPLNSVPAALLALSPTLVAGFANVYILVRLSKRGAATI